MLTAWFVHLYTASGALFAFLAMNRIFYDRYQDAFFWLFLAVIVDGTDGILARHAAVASRLPWVNGEKLDDDQLLFEHTLLLVGGSETTRWRDTVVGGSRRIMR